MIFTIVTLTIFFFETLLVYCNLIASLISNWKSKKAYQIPGLRKELKCLLEELHMLNPQETFAKYARVQRKVNKLQDEISSIAKDRTYLQAQIKYGLKLAIFIFYILCSFFIILLYRNEVCTRLPSNWFSPMGRLLSFPINKPGVISVPVWMGICRIVSKKILS